jgi:SPP1 family predicted phage head-tail adaptor
MSPSPIAAGLRRHLVQLANPGTATPDGDGGFVQTLTPLTPPAVWAEVRPVTGGEVARYGTSLATCDTVVTIPFHAQITTQTQVTHKGRTLYVKRIDNPEDRDRESILYCTEVVP